MYAYIYGADDTIVQTDENMFDKKRRRRITRACVGVGGGDNRHVFICVWTDGIIKSKKERKREFCIRTFTFSPFG